MKYFKIEDFTAKKKAEKEIGRLEAECKDKSSPHWDIINELDRNLVIRCELIIKAIQKLYGETNGYVDRQEFEIDENDSMVYYNYRWPNSNMFYYDKDICEEPIELHESFPIHWLWTDFKQELTDGRSAYLELESVIRFAKGKLSEKEQRALGI